MRITPKSIWCLILSAAFFLILLPLQAYAATTTVSYIDENGNTQYIDAQIINNSTRTLSTSWYLVNSNVTIDDNVQVNGDTKLILTDGCRLKTDSILLTNSNSLTIYGQEYGTGELVAVYKFANSNYPGIGIYPESSYPPASATITIYGGIVKATGGLTGAGIGTGHNRSDNITININGGTVEAESKGHGAGIGAANTNSGNVTINIKGGTITATSGNGPGIGVGPYYYGGSANITIEGGTITAKSTYGADIGGGGNVTTAITGGSVTAFKYNPAPTGSVVCSTTITLQNVKTSTPISSLTIDGATYNPGNLSTNANGEFSFWLTTGTEVTQVEAGGQVYQGSVLAGSEGTLDDITAPTVQNVTPNGSAAARSGNIVIQFSEEMDSTTGTVSLDNGIGDLPAGSWDVQNKTYAVPYSGLDYLTTYTITISGFQDLAGNAMDPDTGYDFTTIIQPLVPTVWPDQLTIRKGRTESLSLEFGQGLSAASSAAINVANSSIASVSNTSLSSTGTITVTGLQKGSTEITVIFNDPATTTVTIPVTVTVPSSNRNTGSNTKTDEGKTEPKPGNITVQQGQNPGDPVTAVVGLSPVSDNQGNYAVTVSDEQIAEAIAQAQQAAKEQGIGIALNINLPENAQGVSLQLSRDVLQKLVDAEVKVLQINGLPISTTLDLAALKGILAQVTGNVTITVSPVPNLSREAAQLIGNRPAYNITISCIKDGQTVNITNLGQGIATIFIPYVPNPDEAVNYLFGVYIDENGQAQPLPGSFYDSARGGLLILTNHFSVYGIGYTAPSAKFTDVQNHWAIKSIDYVVSRGLLRGTSETSFSPDIPITRGMLVTVLGRLAEIDTNSYKAASFADVSADHIFAPYIEWAYQKGIIKEAGNKLFAPDRPITREEIAAVLVNYAKATGLILPASRQAVPYADQELIDDSSLEAVQAMQQAGIMTGGTGNLFNPQGQTSRAEFASILHRYLKLTSDR